MEGKVGLLCRDEHHLLGLWDYSVGGSTFRMFPGVRLQQPAPLGWTQVCSLALAVGSRCFGGEGRR